MAAREASKNVATLRPVNHAADTVWEQLCPDDWLRGFILTFVSITFEHEFTGASPAEPEMLNCRLFIRVQPGKPDEPAFAVVKWSLAFRIAAPC